MTRASILIVENDRIVAEYIQISLERMGHEVSAIVSSGEGAIQRVKEQTPDLVLMDIKLEGEMNGIEAAGEIRSLFSIPIVYLTAYSDDDMVEMAKATEPFGYVIKPFEDRELRTVIEIALYKHDMEKKLRESEEKYRMLVENMNEGVASIDENGEFVYVNDKYGETLGYSRYEIVGKHWTKFFDENAQNIIKEQLLKRKEGSFAPYEVENTRRSGEKVHIRISSCPIYNAAGDIKGSMAILSDITELKRLEEDHLKVQKLESVGILAGGIAHDFNNILTTIIGNVSLAKTQIRPNDEIFDLLNEAEMASTRAQALTKQLLTFAKGGAPLKETTLITNILKESCDVVLRGSKSTSELLIPENPWPVEVDIGQISQVINNIMINANQAMPEGGIIRIAVDNLEIEDKHSLPLKPGRYIRVSIKDQGVGIAEKHLLKIFDPYFTTKQAGSGLGLSTAYSIIRRHDGHITAESQLEVGTTFHIYLPASEKAVPEKEETELISGQGRILLMDDEASLRKIVERMLERLGYEPASAKDGAEAIEMYKTAKKSEKPYDAVILDLTVPGKMGGKQCVAELLEIDSEVIAIVSSGYSQDPVLSNYEEYGFKGMIPKPFESLSLSKVLHEVLNDK